MSNTQYNNRKLHIQNSTIWHLYPGDCGSKVYMTYEPNAKTVKFYRGKYFVSPSGDLLELTEDRFGMVTNNRVLFRDVQGCLYTDGYCETCGGTLTRSFSKTGNVGFLSNVNTGAPVAQQVLRTKHLTSTNAGEYVIPHVLKDYLVSDTNNIFLRRNLHNNLHRVAFGFNPKDISNINDLKYQTNENEIDAAYFSAIKFMYVGEVKEDGNIVKHQTRTAMGSDKKTHPHLSSEVLNVIRRHPEDIVTQDGISWLLLRNLDPNVPVMRCTVVSNSIRQFVEKFKNLTTTDVERYTSMNDYMRDLTQLIWIEGKVGTHITHISCLARASLITSKKDFHVPVMTDPDNVMFGKLGRNIPARSIGGLAAFQSFGIAVTKPVSFIVAHESAIFDEFMGYKDTVENNASWPLVTGSLLEEEPFIHE
jgi:hypothetical protein